MIETVEGHCSINESVKQNAQGPAVHLEQRERTYKSWEADADAFQTINITVCEQRPQELDLAPGGQVPMAA